MTLDVLTNRPLNHEGQRSFVGGCKLRESHEQRRIYTGAKGDLLFGFGERLPGHDRKCKRGCDHKYLANVINIVDIVNLFPVQCQVTIRSAAVLAAKRMKKQAA